MRPNLADHTFTELAALRDDLRRLADNLFDELVSGEKSASAETRLDSDPLHDKLPYRLIRVTADIAVVDPQALAASRRSSRDG